MKRSRQPTTLNTQTNTNTNSNTETGANISSVPSPKSVKRNWMPRQEKWPTENENQPNSSSRLQQPPANINTNLMKIKLESDYVPIVAVKQEVTQDVKPEMLNSDDNDHDNDKNKEDEKVEINLNSPSVRSSTQFQSSSKATEVHDKLQVKKMETNSQSVLNHANSSSSASGVENELNPQEPEVEHPFNCLQISRVKSEDSEIDQEDQEEEKVVVKVETDRSDSVAMETSENETEQETVGKLEERIQKYVQKVISLHREKTKIQTSLKTEIVQLNLVIEQLKTQVDGLNSSTTLQQNENKELEAQVAEQQQEIEKLKNKLKAIENSNSPAVPFLLPKKALSRVFDFLDINSLKESRLVCRLWRCEAGEILLQNFYLVCDDEQRCENALQNWLKSPDSKSDSTSTVKPTAQKLLSKQAKNSLKLLKNFPWLGNSIRVLKYSNYDRENLYQILLFLPNLQVLETKALDLNPQRNCLKSKKKQSRHRAIPIELELLLKKLEMLKELKLDFEMSLAQANLFLRPSIQNKNLELHAAAMNITRFTLDLNDQKSSAEAFRSFLLKISPSLQHLKLLLKASPMKMLELSTSSFEPWTDEWPIIPLGLLRLETLEIERAVGEEKEDIVLKCILAALRLPRLRKLKIDNLLLGRQLHESIKKWNSHESANGRTLQSQSLEELEIVPHFIKSDRTLLLSECIQKRIPGHPWPQLKSLKCAWKNPETFEPHFLRDLRNLERLELNILTAGCKKSHNKSLDKFQLRGLKKLKSFCLKVPGNGKRYQDFAKSVAQKDLIFMKSLQSVQFHRTLIDAAPLKSVLGPNLLIIFTN